MGKLTYPQNSFFRFPLFFPLSVLASHKDAVVCKADKPGQFEVSLPDLSASSSCLKVTALQ